MPRDPFQNYDAWKTASPHDDMPDPEELLDECERLSDQLTEEKKRAGEAKERITELKAERDQLRAALLSAPPARSRNVALDYESWYRTNVEPLKDGRG